MADSVVIGSASLKFINQGFLYGRTEVLKAGDIESNPGPRVHERQPAKKIKIISQNCRGLNEHIKLKAILNKSQKALADSSLTLVC